MLKRLLKRMILWALDGGLPQIVIIQKTDSPQMIDIRVPKEKR